MRNAVGPRVLFIAIATLLLAIPVMADNVTVSGNVQFSSLDGSALDHDGVQNGTFTVNDGDLTVLGTINCNDDGAGANSACAMSFAVSGNLTVSGTGAIYAENRTGGGNGGNITFNVGGNVVLQSGAVISSGTSSTGTGGAITVNAGGSTLLNSSSTISAASTGGNAGAISIIGAGSVTVNGLVASGPSRTVAATKYTGPVLTGGSANAAGGNITIRSTSHAEPAVSIGGTGVVVSEGENVGSGVVAIEGCGININGLVATVADEGTSAKVAIRSGTTITLDGRDLGGAGTRLGMIRADALQQSAASFSANLFARNAINVLGPTAGTLYAVNSNGGTTSNDASGTINVISTAGTASASGNAFSASGNDAGDQGGAINVSARDNVNLDTAKLRASGGTTNSNRKGGSIAVRSYSGGVSWQNGSGDVRPVGSAAGVPAAQQGTITLTYCTTVSTAGSTFPTNGSPVGPFPTTAQTCSPAAPSLPNGESHPDCNDPPIAANDAYTVAEGGTLNVPAPGVLGNDVDPDGNPITAILVSGPAHASSFTFNANGSFNYVHDGSETTTDSFTYKANDGSLDSNVATVTITITPVNDAPVANNDTYTVAEGGTLNVAAPGVMSNDTDPDGPTMTTILVSGPAHAASFALNPNGSFIYIHDGSETTSDSFTYRVTDGSLLSNIATVSITVTPVNDPPTASADTYGVNEGGTLNVPAPGVLTNDSDPDSPTITAVLVSGPLHASSFVLNANGSFTYTHDGSETTSDSFTYQASDGSALSNVVTVTINITPVNDAPVANNDGPYTVAEGGTLNGTSVLANDTDAENNPLTAVLVSGPAHASSFNLNANGTFTYVHDGSETTSDSFTYQANDGSALSNVATVTITITPVNDAPVANNDGPYSVNEGATLNGTSVLANDTDAENDSLTAVLVSGPAHASSFTLNADGTFTYTHDGTETTSDSFTYRANDGTANSNIATVTITINPVNDAPVAVDNAYAVNEGGTLTVPAPGVLGNDTDAENDSLNAVLVSGPAHATSFALNADGSFSYTHDGTETTTDSFTYRANDGTANSNIATVTITINPVNDAPVAVNDAYAVNEGDTLTVPAPGVLGNDTDAENNTLNAVLVSGPAHASSFTLNPDGSFNYVHDGSETTTDSFTYRANDGTANSNIATVTITINPVNDAPVANNDAYNTSVGGTLNVPAPGVLGNDTDVDSPTITAVLVSGPSQATSFTLNPNGSFSYTHNGSGPGTDSFTYRANDGSLNSNIATVTITITAQPPVAVDDTYTTVGNTELRVGLSPALTPHVLVSGDVLDNDTDPDTPNPALTVTTFDATSANGGTVSMDAQGRFSYLPPVANTAPDTFNYVVSDGTNTDVGTVHINFVNRVWYVNAAHVGASTGRSTEPFTTLTAAQTNSFPNDYIHVAAGAYGTGIVLQAGQRLVGSGVPLIVGAFTLAPATTRPTIGGTITLGNNDVVTGLNVNAGGFGIVGTSVVTGTIASVGVTSGSDGISLSSAMGPFFITDVTVTTTGGAGLVMNGGSATVTATNLDVVTTTGTAILGNAGSLTINPGSNGSTAATTNGKAVDLSGMSLNITLLSASASNSTNGIVLNNTTGSFSVTGTGTTAGSGGTITNMSARGVSATNTGSVSLKNMNFVNAATANGSTAVVCGDTLNATNTGCNAALHFATVNGVTLNNVLVDGSAQIGINGNNVTGLSMTNVEVRNAGDEFNEHGVQFAGLFGTVSITGSNFHDNTARQFVLINSSGTVNASITGTTFNGKGKTVSTGAQGALISGAGSANLTVNVQTSTFSNNFSHGYQSDTAGTASLTITLNASNFLNNGGAGLSVASAGSSTVENITNNTLTGNGAAGISAARGGSSVVSGTVSNNVVGNPLVVGSGCSALGCDGMAFNATGSGSSSLTVSNNQVSQFGAAGIRGNPNSGSNVFNIKISGNTISNPNGADNGIFVQSGAVSTDTTSVCADITGNTISGTYLSTMIRVRNRFPATTFSLPGFAGPGNSTAAVNTFLSGQNGGATASSTINGNIFGGGAGCGTP